MRSVRRLASAWAGGVVALAAAAALSGCSVPAAAERDAVPGRLQVSAGFYPLQYVSERIGGHRVQVTSLTRPGAEPHDLELTPRDVARLQDTDLVVYLKGFQPALDDALAVSRPRHAFDASAAARLNLDYTPLTEPGGPRARQRTDPHFWLDPQRLQDVAVALERSMAEADPAGAPDFARNLAALRADLDALDRDLAAGLRSCTSRDLVTGHAAFGYLAQRYDLHQVGISGLTPDAEPDPRRLADAAAYVRRHHVRTVYVETLASPAVARTVARETGARTAVLDPLEGLTGDSPGADYLSVMRANLAQLKEGQPCP